MFRFAAVFVFLISQLSFFSARSSNGDSASGIAGKTYALVISISAYPNEPRWPIANSKADAENISAFIKKFGTAPDVQVLLDKQATKKNILEKINYIMSRVSASDVVYIHFSGAGMQVEDNDKDETDGYDEAFMPYDAPPYQEVNQTTPAKAQLSRLFLDDELVGYINNIRKKLGPKGQCLFSIDASYFGPAEPTTTASVGRGGFLEVEQQGDGRNAPFIMITSCLERETSYFISTKSDTLLRSFSTAVKNFSAKSGSGSSITYNEFFSALAAELKQLSPTQTPTLSGDAAGKFVLLPSRLTNALAQNEAISPDATMFILSIGINKYNGPYQFDNCARDAQLFTRSLSEAFTTERSANVKTYELLNNNATKEAIVKAINEIIAAAKDNDLFAFFFAGFSNQPELQNGQYAETWFYPFTEKPISIHTRNGFQDKDVITLSELKKLLDYLKCDKQLLFTEAGPSKNFKREFVRSMIKTNPVIADIVKRNRVIIIPSNIGLDFTICKKAKVDHAPGIYYFSAMKDSGLNVLDLFSSNKEKRTKLVFEHNQTQNSCAYPDQEYMSYFFEKEFVEDLQYYFAKDDAGTKTTRGLEDDQEVNQVSQPVIKNKYALVIGTNKFRNYRQLDNAINDARAIADTLKSLFGFKTTLLENPSQADIYQQLYRHHKMLSEDDQFILYVAGHGHYDSTVYNDGFIVTSDSKRLDSDTFLTSLLPFNGLRTITDNFKARQVLVLLDVCFSGAFDEGDDIFLGNSNYQTSYRINNTAVNNKLRMVTRKYITAGSKVEEVPDNFNGRHSPFAYFLLEGLRRAAKEKKFLSSGMLFRYIQAYLEDTAPLQSGYGKDQLRLGSEFIFLSK
jgi:hypothetical protein